MTASQPSQHTSPAEQMVSTTPEVPPPAAAQLKPTERPHPLTPLVRCWLILVAIAIGWGRRLGLVPPCHWRRCAAGRNCRAGYLVLHPFFDRRRGTARRDRRDLQEINEDPVRAAPVGRHHPTAGRPNGGACRAAPRRRKQHHQASLPQPRQGISIARLSAHPGPRTAGQHPRS